MTPDDERDLLRALAQRIRPVLVIDGLDGTLTSVSSSCPSFIQALTSCHQLASEEVYQRLVECMASLNLLVSAHQDSEIGQDVRVAPGQLSVAFASSSGGWAFTLADFADRYAARFSVRSEQLLKRFWGDNYFDAGDRRWTSRPQTADGQSLPRGFVTFVLDIICRAMSESRELTEEPLTVCLTAYVQLCIPTRADFDRQRMLRKLNLRLTTEETQLDPSARSALV